MTIIEKLLKLQSLENEIISITENFIEKTKLYGIYNIYIHPGFGRPHGGNITNERLIIENNLIYLKYEIYCCSNTDYHQIMVPRYILEDMSPENFSRWKLEINEEFAIRKRLEEELILKEEEAKKQKELLLLQKLKEKYEQNN